MRKHPHNGKNTRNSPSTNREYKNNKNPAMERLRTAIHKKNIGIEINYTPWQKEQIEEKAKQKEKAKGSMFWHSDKRGTFVR